MYVGELQTVLNCSCDQSATSGSLYWTWLTLTLPEAVSRYHNDNQQIDNYTRRTGTVWDIRYDECKKQN
jgi:hypothetical protein